MGLACLHQPNQSLIIWTCLVATHRYITSFFRKFTPGGGEFPTWISFQKKVVYGIINLQNGELKRKEFPSKRNNYSILTFEAFDPEGCIGGGGGGAILLGLPYPEGVSKRASNAYTKSHLSSPSQRSQPPVCTMFLNRFCFVWILSFASN